MDACSRVHTGSHQHCLHAESYRRPELASKVQILNNCKRHHGLHTVLGQDVVQRAALHHSRCLIGFRKHFTSHTGLMGRTKSKPLPSLVAQALSTNSLAPLSGTKKPEVLAKLGRVSDLPAAVTCFTFRGLSGLAVGRAEPASSLVQLDDYPSEVSILGELCTRIEHLLSTSTYDLQAVERKPGRSIGHQHTCSTESDRAT